MTPARVNGSSDFHEVMTTLDNHGQRISKIEGQITGLATAAAVSSLETMLTAAVNENRRQHTEIKASFDRCLSDEPTSLKSQIASMQGASKWASGYIAACSTVFGSLVGAALANLATIKAFFHWWMAQK